MSFLEKLLEGVSVEWKPLGEVTFWDKRFQGVNPLLQPTVLNFKHVSAAKLKSLKKSNGNVKLLSTGNFDGYTTKDLAENNINFGEVITIPTGGTANLKYYNGEFVDSGNLLGSSRDINLYNLKYIYIYLLNINDIIQSYFRGSGVKHPSMSDILAIPIPIPCPDNPKKSLEIQQKIVAILDTFTELTAELTAELTNRKQQYSYYREQLFVFDENEVKHLPMDDDRVGEFQRGKRFVKTDLISEGEPTIHYGEMYTHYGTWADKTISFVSQELVKSKNLRKAQKGDVVIVAAGETIEDIGKGTAWLGDEDVVIHDACFSYKTTLNPKFVAYFTRTKQFHDQIKKHISSGKISAINAKGLGKALIPVPSKEEQERIVSILDKFDVLTTSISEGLPKEIVQRKQQYEYYRNLLLTFPKDN